jgi:hypothetical protein
MIRYASIALLIVCLLVYLGVDFDDSPVSGLTALETATGHSENKPSREVGEQVLETLDAASELTIRDSSGVASNTAQGGGILDEDERDAYLGQLELMEKSSREKIHDFDENLADIQKRREIEKAFLAESQAYQAIAVKLAKDELAREKMNAGK